MIKVGYEAGHGIKTPGKQTPAGEKEWSFNSIVAQSFGKELSLYEGVTTKRFDDPTGKYDVPLQERTDGANAWGADYYISFHHNAFTGKWGTHTGVETYIYTSPGEKSIALANVVHPAVVSAYGLRDRGIKRANLHIVRETRMPAILVEGGFMDSSIDIQKLRDSKVLENAGKAVAQAFAQFAGLKKKPVKNTVKHTVVRGDTLYSLAKRYGVTVAKIQQLNAMGKSTLIKVGQSLIIK